MTGGSATNCIFYYNGTDYPAIGDENVKKSSGSIGFSCMQPLVGGTGNTEGNPDFANRQARNYRLNFGSPCVDGGTNISYITVDLAWTNRPVDGDGNGDPVHDMGCYEKGPVGAEFVCDFTGGPLIGTNNMNVIFTATVGGSGTDTVVYCWEDRKSVV